MSSGLKLAALLASFVVLSAPATALAVAFGVDRTIGAGGVTGFIETDGTLGPLSVANIVDWNLLLDDGSTTFNIFGPLSGDNSALLIRGSSLTATATDLLFDFSNGANDIALFQNPHIGSGDNFWCIEGTDDGCAGAPSPWPGRASAKHRATSVLSQWVR